MGRNGLLQPVGYQAERRRLAKARKQAFLDPPTRRNPDTNGVIERTFQSYKYEHLYRREITDGVRLAAEAEALRQVTLSCYTGRVGACTLAS